MGQFFNKSCDEVFSELKSSANGLSQKEANFRLDKFGKNAILESKEKSTFLIFLEQFKDLLVIILIIAAVISLFFDSLESAVVIIAVIIFNAILGTVQNVKAKKSLKSLKSLSAPIAKVIRDGKIVKLPADLVVPGDVVVQESGDIVVADGRIIENYMMQVNESALTGESEIVKKTSDVIMKERIPIGDKTNMVFSGSFVTYGHALVMVTATGMNTEIGKIATLMNKTGSKKTTLQISLDNFSKKLAMIIMIICILVFLLHWIKDTSKPFDALMFAVAMAVAAIPEALSSLVTIVQAIGTQRMVKHNAIIKELKAVETLGCVSVICSDKTGTLTQNKMTVQSIYCDGKIFSDDEVNLDDYATKSLINIGVLVNDSTLNGHDSIGDPTEVALIEFARKLGIDENIIRQDTPRVSEIPFDSDRKMMSSANDVGDSFVLLTKGALDVLIPRLSYFMTNDGIRNITKEDIDQILKVNEKFTSSGLRVLCMAIKNIDHKDITLEDEDNYVFVGLVAMVDPPRYEAKRAVEDAKRAGIRSIMITGDHKTTAVAIAKQLGIFGEGDLAITGEYLDSISDYDLRKIVDKISVYARVSPEHKIRIVSAWQESGHVVAMTGDGVNDAPALKKADIGVAMGITGTEVAKDASDMILTDDNYSTIVKAVENGRNVYENIRNSVRFLISGNTAAILVVLYTALIPGLTAPFIAVQLLFINLITDSLPALAIGMEKSRHDLLNKPPRSVKESILNKNTLKEIGVQGFIIALFTMFAYYLGLNGGNFPELAMTMAFATITIARLFHGFNCRGEKDIVTLGVFSNIYCIIALILGLVLLFVVLFVPFFMNIFDTVNIGWAELGWILMLSFFPTFIVQIYKMIKNSIYLKN